MSVRGDDICPLYKYLTTCRDEKIAGDVPWNFTKYLINRKGQVIAKFGPRTLPENEEVIAKIEEALAVKVDTTD